jgi:hypothetical protein
MLALVGTFPTVQMIATFFVCDFFASTVSYFRFCRLKPLLLLREEPSSGRMNRRSWRSGHQRRNLPLSARQVTSVTIPEWNQTQPCRLPPEICWRPLPTIRRTSQPPTRPTSAGKCWAQLLLKYPANRTALFLEISVHCMFWRVLVPLFFALPLTWSVCRQKYNEFVLCLKKNDGDEDTCKPARALALSICPEEWVSKPTVESSYPKNQQRDQLTLFYYPALLTHYCIPASNCTPPSHTHTWRS